ncbi:MAG: nucleoside triphosphate pyrophosphohydrolase [Rhodospirillales bacterium]|nr:nucleoside triphosphate pyrophosphohydrolase [Rhodospirillales bacterium]MCB9973654.1 nucleoside triphosphate pyrophosphohydrolase [Rhodospirillales bacterium]
MSAEKLQKIQAHDRPIDRLLELMRSLRDPNGGCPWDLEQDFDSIAKYAIEEAYEVADAIRRDNMHDLKDELGDLLLQVVFHARIAQEKGLFDFDDIASFVTDKMIERHPHVFVNHQTLSHADQVLDVWEAQKEQQKPRESVLDDITLGLPGLMRAQKLQKRAAHAGFEWQSVSGVLEKFKEEMAEFEEAMSENDPDHLREEYGDVLFVMVNLGRMMGYDVEEVMRNSNDKFERRFKGMEKILKSENKELSSCSLEEMEQAWQAQKKNENL